MFLSVPVCNRLLLQPADHARRSLPASFSGRHACTQLQTPVLRAGILSRQRGSHVSASADETVEQRGTKVVDKVATAIASNLGGQVFVAGGSGLLGARIVKELLQAGFKVTAGVPDAEEAAGIVDFAKRYELLKADQASKLQLTEVDFSDEEAIAEALPRNARVIAIAGDTVSGRKADGRVVDRLLGAATARPKSIAQFVLVAPSGAAGGGGGGFLGLLFGGGGAAVGGSGSKPSRIEQEIASSGLDFVIVRHGRVDNVEESFAAKASAQVGPQASLPAGARATRSQVAEVVAQVLKQASTDVLVEAWSAADAPATPVEQLVAQVLPEAAVQEEEVAEEEDEEEEEEAPAPIPAIRRGAASAAGRAAAAVGDDEDEEDEEEDAKPASVLKGFFGAGTRRIKAKAGEAVDSAPSAPSPAPLFGSFGTVKRKVQATAEDVKEEVADKPKPAGLFGFGKGKAKEEEDDDEEENGANPIFSLFGAKPAKAAEAVEQRVRPSATQARNAAAQGANVKAKAAKRAGVVPGNRPGVRQDRAPPGRPGRPAPPAPKAKAKPPAPKPKAAPPRPQPKGRQAPGRKGGPDKDEKPKKGGFLSLLGIQQDTVYADED